MSSLFELIGQFIAVLVAAAFMHFGALLADTVDGGDTRQQASESKASTSQNEAKSDEVGDTKPQGESDAEHTPAQR